MTIRTTAGSWARAARSRESWRPTSPGRGVTFCEQGGEVTRVATLPTDVGAALTVGVVDKIDVGFCFLDDPDFVTDADRDSRLLRRWHQRLWSKSLSEGQSIAWDLEPGTSCLVSGAHRVSSDTIATTHSNYQRLGASQLWEALDEHERLRFDRLFYTIGGFIIFPTRPQSLNQRRGTGGAVADRFDLTLECIRQHYIGLGNNPLADVLSVDAAYFRLFGQGAAGFATFIEFFHLQDLATADAVRWLDGRVGGEWRFDRPALPQTLDDYRKYLANVADFVAARNARIREWCDQHSL